MRPLIVLGLGLSYVAAVGFADIPSPGGCCGGSTYHPHPRPISEPTSPASASPSASAAPTPATSSS